LSFRPRGWKQILTARKKILDAYDRAREQARAREVDTLHGRVVEATFREWLSDFLPKRYGATSGYIVSSGPSSKPLRYCCFSRRIDVRPRKVKWLRHGES
jgi:hypothetical protein